MAELVKTFTVSARWLERRLPRMLACVNRLNSRRVGRTRRGQWMLVGISGHTRDIHPDAYRVAVTLRKAPPKMQGGVLQRNGTVARVKWSPYRHDDVGKVLKDLTVAARKWANHAAPAAAST